MSQISRFFIGLIALIFVTITYAEAELLQRKDVKQFINKMVRQYHFDRRQLNAIMKEAVFQPQIIESMDKPFEKKNWDIYKELFLQPDRVQAGIEFWQMNQKALERAEHDYGVPPQIIVSIIGVETLYGKHQGNYRVLDALTTLAFNYPKRSEFFTKELAEYLLLCREQGVPVTKYTGSYAGAIGKPQFMPSSYRFYAVDYSGRRKPDLVNNDSDVIGSVANYFHRHGWKKSEGIAAPVNVAGNQYKHIAMNAKTANYSLKHLLASGIKPATMLAKPPLKAGIIELTTQRGQEYWLAYPNFYVITHYNTSPQYALVVYIFSQQLYNQWAALHSQRAHRYV